MTSDLSIEQKRLLAKRKLAKEKLQGGNITPEPPVDVVGLGNAVGDAISFGQPREEREPNPIPNWAVVGESLTRELPSNVLGFPGDIYNLALNTLKSGIDVARGKGDEPYQPVRGIIPDSEFFKEKVFREVADREDYTGGQRLLGNVLTLGGEGLVGGVGLATKAKYADDAVGLFADMFKPYIDRPVAQPVQDFVTGAGAGGGLTFAEETDQGPIGTLFSTTLGGMSTTPTAKLVENTARGKYARGESVVPGTSRRTLDDVRSIVTEPQTSKSTGQTAGPLVTDRRQALENIDRSLADADEIGIVDPTLGPASGDVGLSMMEVKQRLKNPQKFAERDQQVRTGIAAKFGEAFSNPDADVTAPQRASSRLIEQETGGQRSQINQLYEVQTQQEGNLRTLKEQGQQIPAEIEARRGAEGRASAALDEQIRGALDERTTAKNQKFEESAKGAYVDAMSLAKLVQEVNAEAPKLAPDARLPDYIMRGIRKFIPQPGTLEGPGSTAGMIPADEVLKLRRYLNTEIQSLKQKGEFTKADTLQSFKAKINETIDLDPQFREANEFYKSEYAPFFAEGYGKKYRDTVQRGDGTGRADAENMAAFFLNKTTSAADDLKRIIEIAPDKQAADNAVEMYFDAMLAKKTLNPKTIRNFIADNVDILPEGVKSKYEGIVRSMMDNAEAQNKALTDLNEMKKTIREAESNLKKTEQSLASGPFGKMSRYDSDKYVADIMGSKDRNKQLAEIKARIGDDQEAMDGFKEATVRWLMKKVKGTDASGVDLPTLDMDLAGRPVVYAKLTRTLDDNREALSQIFTPEEMNTLNRMQQIMSRQGNLARRATTGSDTAEKLTQTEQQVMDTLEVALKVKFGMLKGAGLNKVVKQVRNVLFGPSKRVINAEELLTRMALDPRVAKHVLEATPLTIENGKWFSELNALIGSQAAVSTEDEE